MLNRERKPADGESTKNSSNPGQPGSSDTVEMVNTRPAILPLTSEEITEMLDDFDRTQERPQHIFSFYPNYYKIIGLCFMILSLGFVIFHKITLRPNIEANKLFWEHMTLNVFLLGILVRMASRSKIEDPFKNHARVNAFARAAIFACLMNCIPVQLLLWPDDPATPIQNFEVEFIVFFYLGFWAQRSERVQKILSWFSFKKKLRK